MRPGRLLLFLICISGLLSAPCALAEEVGAEDFVDFEDPFSEEEEVTVADPLEPLNRGVFWVNDKLYFYVFKPIARGYRRVPESARSKVGNFFDNLAAPVRLVNCLLQGKAASAGNELRRFLFNSTLGFAGLLDPAARRGWNASNEDLGQTLGVWGVGQGIYLVLPVLGPSSIRDGIGLLGDGFLDPVPYAADGTFEFVAIKGYEQINALSLDDDTYEAIIEQALDSYLFVRNAYIQRRQGLVRK